MNNEQMGLNTNKEVIGMLGLVPNNDSELRMDLVSDTISSVVHLLKRLNSEGVFDGRNDKGDGRKADGEAAVRKLRELSETITEFVSGLPSDSWSGHDQTPVNDITLPYKQTSLWENTQIAPEAHAKPMETYIKPFEENITSTETHIKPYEAHIKPYEVHIRPFEAHIKPYEVHIRPYEAHIKPHEVHIKPLEGYIDESEYLAMGARANNIKELENSAASYMERLEQHGCAGVCALRDSCSCSGGKCETCGVCMGGMCVKSALRKRKFPQVREPDGGDYRSAIGDGLDEKREADGDYDKEIRDKTNLRVMTKEDLEQTLRKLRLLKKSKSLELDWQDVSLDDVLSMYPGIDRRETRIEIQMGIYTWMNYRNDICVRHMEERFGLPVREINKRFKDYYGVTFPIFLHKIRSAAAKRLLLIDSLRMNEISEIIGYKSTFHFSVNFKRIEGISPNFYKSLYIKNGGRTSEKEIQRVRELNRLAYNNGHGGD